MLPAHLVADNGLKIIKEYPNLISNLRTHIGDLDVSASYPNGGATHNQSKETTKKELISIDGVSDHVRRMQGINLSGGASNSVEFCSNIFKMPTISMLIEAYRSQADQSKVKEEYENYVASIATLRIDMSDEMMAETMGEMYDADEANPDSIDYGDHD